jgi:hypothetical protein
MTVHICPPYTMVVMQALLDENPKPRYLIVPNQEQPQWTINRVIERLVEQTTTSNTAMTAKP